MGHSLSLKFIISSIFSISSGLCNIQPVASYLSRMSAVIGVTYKECHGKMWKIERESLVLVKMVAYVHKTTFLFIH